MLLKIKNLNFKDILKNVNFEMSATEKILLLGESGSGKSTFFKALNLLINPNYEQFEFLEQNISDFNIYELRQKNLLLFQEPFLFQKDVKQELLWPFTLENCKLEKPSNSKLNSILELCCLEKELDESTQFFSGGEKQRLCLARTLLLNPKLLLLDEPTSALNEELSDTILENILEYKKETAMIIISHNKKLEKYGLSLYEMKDGALQKGNLK